MDVATLGLEIDSRPVDRASKDLDRLNAAAAKAEKATTGLAGGARRSTQQTEALAAATRKAEQATMGATSATRAYDNGLNAIDRALKRGSISTQQHAAALDTLNTRYQTTATAANAAETAMVAAGRASGFARMQSRQLMFQLVDIGQAIPLAFQSPLFALQNMGFQVAQIGQLYHGNGGMGAALRDSISMVGRFAVKLAPIAAIAAAAGLGLAGLTHEINETTDVTVSFGDTAVATFQVIRDAVASVLAPAFAAIAPYVQAAWDEIVAGTKFVGNFVINSWRVVALEIGTVFDKEAASLEERNARIREIMASDPLGELFEEIRRRAVENAQEYSEETEKVVTGLKDEHEALTLLRDAHMKGGRAVEDANDAIEVGNELRKAEVERTSKAGQEILRLVVANNELERSIKDITDAERAQQSAIKEATRAVERLQEDATKAGLDGVKLLMAERDLALKEFTEQKAKELGLEKEFAAARLAIEQIYQREKAELEADAAEKAAEEARKAAEKQAEILRRPFENAIDGIQDSFTDFFEDVFSGGIDSFKKLAEGIKGIFIRMAAELASQRLMQTILGGGSSTAAAGLGTGGSSAFNLGSIFSGIGGIFGGGSSASAGAAGGAWGQGAGAGAGAASGAGLGGLSGAVAAIPVWGWIAAAAMTAKSFVEGSKPGSPQGVLDTLLLPSLDQWQNNPGRSAINALDPIGTAFGDVFGNDGAAGILGGLLIGPGAFLGNLFSKKPSVGPNAVSTLINRNGLLSGNAGRADNGGSAQGAQDFANAVAQAINAITGDLGATFPGTSPFRVGTFGGQFRVGDTYNGGRLSRALGKDPQAAAEAAALYGFENFALEGIDPALAEAVQRAAKISADLEDFSANIGVARAVLDETLFNAEEISQAEQALKDVAAAFEDAAERADRLGLSVAKVEELREQALRDLTEGFDEGIRAQILAITDPVTAALEAQAKTAEQRLKDAETLGADLVEVERLNALERQRVLEQAGGGLNRFFEELTFGSLSGVSPGAGVEGSRAAFEAAVASGSIGEIERLGRGLVNTSREAFASGPQFQSDLARVTDVVGSYVTSNDNAINTYAQESLPIFHQMAASLAALEQRAARQEDEIRRLNNRLEANAA